MNNVRGTEGYGVSVGRFIEVTESLDFNTLHSPYLDLIPTTPSRALDIGAGVGRDAGILASLGHTVVAVEPMPEFLDAAKMLHSSPRIRWVEDSLPDLAKLRNIKSQFSFVLASGVWHHINEAQRSVAMSHIVDLLSIGGVFALSLRNGPAGAGTYTFPTDAQKTIAVAKDLGLEAIVVRSDLPSLIEGKSDVKWAKLAFRRI